jgi:predicted nucleic acid-binding Zn ribbon protein
VEEVGKILPAILKRHVQRPDARVVEILAPFWSQVAGKAMARQCRPVAFREGTLTLATECSSWSVQLQQMAEEIRAEINSFLGKPVVKKLRVQRVARLDLIEAPQTHRQIPHSSAAVQRHWKDYAA